MIPLPNRVRTQPGNDCRAMSRVVDRFAIMMMNTLTRRYRCISSAAIMVAACMAHHEAAQASDDGFQWTTITDVNNPAYGGGPFGENAGRGSVAYEYRISRHELTSSQFLDFINNSDDATFETELGRWLDIESFATYLAVQELIGNSDDIDGPGNNSYLYYDSESGQFTVVAWDHNLANIRAAIAASCSRRLGLSMIMAPLFSADANPGDKRASMQAAPRL